MRNPRKSMYCFVLYILNNCRFENETWIIYMEMSYNTLIMAHGQTSAYTVLRLDKREAMNREDCCGSTYRMPLLHTTSSRKLQCLLVTIFHVVFSFCTRAHFKTRVTFPFRISRVITNILQKPIIVQSVGKMSQILGELARL